MIINPSNIKSPKSIQISIITICFNEEKNIRKTLDSIVKQKTDNYELIIQDGGSEDNTLEIIKEYEGILKKRNIRFVVNSGKDGGIYFGMNRAIDHASCDYAIFMNAGDCFRDERVLIDVINELTKYFRKPDVLYGDYFWIDGNSSKHMISTHRTLYKKDDICHQAAFIKLIELKRRPYDTTYKLAADYEYWLYLFSSDKTFRHINRDIADYNGEGRSVQYQEQSYSECLDIRKKYVVPNCFFSNAFFYGRTGNAANQINTNYYKPEWSDPEECATWSLGNTSSFYISIEHNSSVKYELIIFCLKTLGYSNYLYVNGQLVGEIKGKTAKIPIQNQLLYNGMNKFTINTTDIVASYDQVGGESGDTRFCNLYVSEISLLAYRTNFSKIIKRSSLTLAWRTKIIYYHLVFRMKNGKKKNLIYRS